MSSSAAPDFPYDHLAVLGFRKLQRYIPPSRVPGVGVAEEPAESGSAGTEPEPPPSEDSEPHQK